MKRFAVITGTRILSNDGRVSIDKWLVSLHSKTLLIHGGAKGADSYAAAWWISAGGQTHREQAAWEEFGLDAGPVRNASMAGMAVELRKRGWTCEGCAAFPGPESRGTWDCVRKLKDAGFDVDVTEV